MMRFLLAWVFATGAFLCLGLIVSPLTAQTDINTRLRDLITATPVKITLPASAFKCAAVTCDVTVTTLPPKTFVVHALADVTQVFACAAVCTSTTLSAVLGKTAGGTQYLASFDLDAAVAQFGDAGAELGASLIEATIPTGIGDLTSWTASTAIVLRMTSGTGNIGTTTASNLSTGSVTIYLTMTVLP